MDFANLREPVSAWTHALGLILALPATWYLWRQSRGTSPARRLGLVVFGLSLAFCYMASMLFHGVRPAGGGIGAYDRLDRVGIFVLIAGTYTPLAGVLLRGRWRAVILTTVWAITLVASALLAAGGPLSRAWMTGLYLGMGWGVVACYAELRRAASGRALAPLILGGAFYSIGAAYNIVRYPALWPAFGPHEVFHLFVLAGSLCHFVFVARVALPHPPGSPRGPHHGPGSPHPPRRPKTQHAVRAGRAK